MPSETPAAIPPTEPPPTKTPRPTSLPFILQPGAPAAGINFSHPELECGWFGVAGHVLGVDRDAVDGMLVEIRGDISGEPVQALAMTGTAPLYGPGGFEIELGNTPVGTIGTLGIQVFDVSGEPVSEIYKFDTYAACDKNLVLITFIEAPDYIYRWFLPSVYE